MSSSTRFLARFAEHTRLVAWLLLWSFLTTGSAPVLCVAAPQQIEIRVPAGLVTHQFGIAPYSPDYPQEPTQLFTSDTLVTNNWATGGYALLNPTWDTDQPFTISDVSTGESQNVDWIGDTVFDFTAAYWGPKQYFLLPDDRPTNNIYLAQPGVWFPLTVAPSLHTGSDGIVFREAFSMTNGSSQFWLEDYSRYERSPSGKGNLLGAVWTPITSPRLLSMTFYLDAENLGRTFSFHSRSEGGGVRTVTAQATLANNGVSFSAQDPTGRWIQIPAGSVQVTGTVGPRMEFWLTRADTPQIETPHYIAPGPTGPTYKYPAFGVFPAPAHTLQWTTFRFPANTGQYAVVHPGGYTAPIQVESTGWLYSYDDWGNLIASIEYAAGGAWVDSSVPWQVVGRNSGTTYNEYQTDLLDWYAYHTDPPAATPGSIGLNIYGGRAGHWLSVHQYNDSGEDITTYSFYPTQWGYGTWSSVDFWNGYQNVSVSVGNYSESGEEWVDGSNEVSCFIPAFTVTVPCYTDRPYWVVDESTGERSEGNLAYWFEAPTNKELQISTSRSGHALYIERLTGTSDKVQEHQTQGDLSVSDDGGITFNSYYYFVATAPHWEFIPFRIVDKDTGETTGWNPTNEELVRWISLPGLTGLTGQLTSSNAVQLSWPLAQASRDGAFLLERCIGNSPYPSWPQIARIPATDAAGNPPIFKYIDRLATPGESNRYRVRYTYGGQLSQPSNVIAIATAPLPTTSSTPPNESDSNNRNIKSPHPTIAEFMNPLQGIRTENRGPAFTTGGGGGIPAFAGLPVVRSDSIIPDPDVWLSGSLELIDPFGPPHWEERIIDPNDSSLEKHTHKAYQVRLRLLRPVNANSVTVQEKKGENGVWTDVPYTQRDDQPEYLWLSHVVNAGHRYFYRLVATNSKGTAISKERYIDVPSNVSREFKEKAIAGSKSETINMRFAFPETDGMTLQYYIVQFDQALGHPLPPFVKRNIVGIERKSVVLGEAPAAGESTRPFSEFESEWQPPEGDKDYPSFASIVPSCVLFGTDDRSLDPDPNANAEFLKSRDTGREILLYPSDSGTSASARIIFQRMAEDTILCSGYSVKYNPAKLAVFLDGQYLDPDIPITFSPEDSEHIRINSQLKVLPRNMAHNEETEITLQVSVTDGSFDTDTLKVRYLARNPDGSPSATHRFPIEEASGARYRKVALNGRPISDDPPQATEETDHLDEETFIDAMTFQLRHSTTDVWAPVPGSDLSLSIRRNHQPEIWSPFHGLEPDTRAYHAFGACWSSNLDAHLRIELPVENRGSMQTVDAYVTDVDGTVHKFMAVGSGPGAIPGQPTEFYPVPTGVHEHSSHLTSLALTDKTRGEWTFRGPFGTEMSFELFGTTLVGSGGGGPPTSYVYGRPTRVRDRLGNVLTYEYETGGAYLRPIPKRIYLNADKSRSVYIQCDSGNYVTDVWDPNGNHWQYQYYQGTESVRSESGTATVRALKKVIDPDGNTKARYGYKITDEPDNRPSSRSDEPRFSNFHCNLTEITNGNGKSHTLEYGWDMSRFDPFSSCAPAGGSSQFGSPRIIKKVKLPDEIGFATFVQKGTPIRIDYVHKDGAFTVNNKAMGALVPTVLGNRTTEITDAYGGSVEFTFLDSEVIQENGLIPVNDSGAWVVEPSAVGTGPRLVAFKKMQVKSSLFPNPEVFEFDLQAGMALKRVEDLNGHVTTYTYGDTTPARARSFGCNWLLSDDGLFRAIFTQNFTHYSRPTAENRAPKPGTAGPNVTTTYQYLRRDEPGAPIPLQLLQRITSPQGRITEYHFDSKGRRYREVVGKKTVSGAESADWNDAPDSTIAGEQITRFDYETGGFPGVIKSKTVLRQAGDPAWANNLVTTYKYDEHGNLRSETSGGLTTWYSYDVAGNKLSVTNPQGHRTSFSYDCRNRLVEIGYPYAPATEGTVEAGSSVTSPVRKTFTYDNAGNKKTETDERGFTTIYEYDALNRVIEEYRPSPRFVGNVSEYARTSHLYNSVGSRIWTKDPRGLETTFQYDKAQRLQYVTAGSNLDVSLQRKITYDYSGTNSGSSIFSSFKPTTITEPRGYGKTIVYDSLFRTTEEKVQYRRLGEEAGLGEAWASTKRTYDNDGNLKTELDPLNRLTTFEYDGINRLRKKIFADQTFTTTDYTSTGLAWRVTDEMRRPTFTEYDGLGRAIKVTTPPVPSASPVSPPPPAPVVTQMAYDLAGNLATKTDGLGSVWQYFYNPRKLKVAEVHPAVSRVEGTRSMLDQPVLLWEYDKAGNVTAATDARGYTTYTHYTPANKPDEITAPWVRRKREDGSVVWEQPATHTVYDPNGNVTQVTDPANKKTVNEYDLLNQLSSTKDDNNITVYYGYDKAGNRTSVKDGKSQTTQFAYDGLNRNTKITYPLGNPQRFQYDGVNKTARIDGKGITTRYAYDARHRLDTVSYSNSGLVAYDYDYNSVGQLTKVQEPRRGTTASAFAVEYDYDALGRVIEELSQGVRHRYYYDAVGQQRAIVYGGSGLRIDKTYDALGRLTSLMERPSVNAPVSSARVTSFSHDLSGNVVWEKQANNEETVRRYDSLGRVELIESTRSSRLIAHTEQFYDLAGNLCWMEERHGPGSGVLDRDLKLTYDNGHRLKEETERSPNNGPFTTATGYSYDDAGNRTRRTDLLPGLLTGNTANNVPRTFIYNGLNQLTSWQDSLGVTRSITYDQNGNRSRSDGTGSTQNYYGYDEENRLIEVGKIATGSSTPTIEHRYSYDYRSRRIARDETLNGALRHTKIIFSGGVSIREEDSVNSAPVDYVRGPDMGGGVGGLLYSLRPGNALRFNHYNARGDVIAQTDSTATVQWAGNYEAFGTHTDSGTNSDRQRANTKEQDPTGLLNEGFRYRDLATGVFLTRDPAGFVDGPNLYTYVRQNPWSKFDPEGLWNETIGWQETGLGWIADGFANSFADICLPDPVASKAGIEDAATRAGDLRSSKVEQVCAQVETVARSVLAVADLLPLAKFGKVEKALGATAKVSKISKLEALGELTNRVTKGANGVGVKTAKQAAKESSRVAETGAKSGVYHVEAKGERYTGSSVDMEQRMTDPQHPARDLLDDPDAVVTTTTVNISDLKTRSARNRALRVVEQDTMDATGNVPGLPGSRNKLRALVPEKQKRYRQQYDVNKRVE